MTLFTLPLVGRTLPYWLLVCYGYWFYRWFPVCSSVPGWIPLLLPTSAHTHGYFTTHGWTLDTLVWLLRLLRRLRVYRFTLQFVAFIVTWFVTHTGLLGWLYAFRRCLVYYLRFMHRVSAITVACSFGLRLVDVPVRLGCPTRVAGSARFTIYVVDCTRLRLVTRLVYTVSTCRLPVLWLWFTARLQVVRTLHGWLVALHTCYVYFIPVRYTFGCWYRLHDLVVRVHWFVCLRLQVQFDFGLLHLP